MGVPKFFRWISERYPKINQPIHCPPNPVTREAYFPNNKNDENGVANHIEMEKPSNTEQDPDIHSFKSSILPEFDRLYFDMNGIIHCCSHNNAGDNKATSDPDTKLEVDIMDDSDDSLIAGENGAVKITEEEVFRNICYYIDRVVTDIVQPKELVYMAIDGVAPRAKMNQQRSRRYRSGKETEIESTFYGIRIQKGMEERERMESVASLSDIDRFRLNEENESQPHLEVKMGTASGKFDTSTSDDSDLCYDSKFDQDYQSFLETIKNESHDDEGPIDIFHSNSITPGTAFFERCTNRLEKFIRNKLQSDPRWSHLTVIFSGPNVPGEGEHKIMSFLRSQKERKDYNVNTRHCLFGQDGDLIMLGLATHEPNFCLLREEVIFAMDRRKALEAQMRAHLESEDANNEKGLTSISIGAYVQNASFELLHMSILREYLAYEFETKDVIPSKKFDLERTIDDFVFMTFFVGNDFLPNMPAIEISEEAFELLFYTYKRLRGNWIKDGKPYYLTHDGEIASGDRLEEFLTELGRHEDPFYDNRKRNESSLNSRMRKMDLMAGREPTIPPDDILKAKEKWDRANFKQMLESIDDDTSSSVKSFTPVATSEYLSSQLNLSKTSTPFEPDDSDVLDAGFFSSMVKSVQNSISFDSQRVSVKENMHNDIVSYDDHSGDLKGRYYYDKFKFSPLDAKKHLDLRKAYVEGLVWNLQYYYRGCVCYDWYYPHHYGPMLSDLTGISDLLEEICFDDEKTKPVTPFEQLICVMPPSSSYLLPKPYEYLMKSPHSPLKPFYPNSFTVDMNGKRWPWEAVVLLPFIDSQLLLETCRNLISDDLLSESEKRRNQVGKAYVYSYKASSGSLVVNDIDLTEWKHDRNSKFRPWISPKCRFPLPGFSTLKEAPVKGFKRYQLGINVFGMRSRYRSAILVADNQIPAIPSIDRLAEKIIGTTVYFRYPHFQEGFVTAVSDAEATLRGTDSARKWTETEALAWNLRSSNIRKQHESGEGITGSGGWKIPESSVSVCLRPLQKIHEMCEGSKVKVYAKTEIELPLVAILWSPSIPDPRLNIPARLEANPYRFSTKQVSTKQASSSRTEVKNSLLFQQYDDLTINSFKSRSNHQFQSKGSGRDFSILPSQSKEKNMKSEVRVSHRNLSTMNNLPLVSSAPQGIHRLRKSGSTRMKTLSTVAATAALFLSSVISIEGNTIFPNTCIQVLDKDHLLTRGEKIEKRHSYNYSSLNQHITYDGNLQTDPLEFSHGTTTISFTFDGGIVVAVDSRASIGNFVGSKTVQKVLVVTNKILGTMAGGAADCSFWIRMIQFHAKYFQCVTDSELTVSRASRTLSDYLYENRDAGLSVGTMIMGYDEDNVARIFYVDNTGKRIEGDLFVVGSGSTFALGVLDRERKKDMVENDAVALCIKAIRHATFRDAFSGGYIAVYVINSSGWRKVFSEDVALSSS